MKGVLFDTHVVVWILLGEAQLSPAVTTAINDSDVFYVSAASIYEIAFKRQRALRRALRMRSSHFLTTSPNCFMLSISRSWT